MDVKCKICDGEEHQQEEEDRFQYKSQYLCFSPRAFDGTTPRVPLKLTSSVKFEGFPLRIALQKTEESEM